MKTLTYVFVFFALLLVFDSCKKAGLSGIQLVATSASVKTGQLDSLELVGAAATDSVKWAVSPMTGLAGIIYSGKHAVVNFNQAGSYTITATLNNATPYSTTINVTQAPAPPVDTTRTTAIHVPLSGDQIVMTAHYSKSPNSDSAYVYFAAQTTKFYYCLNSSLTYNVALNNTSGFTLNIVDVLKPATKDCQVGSTRLTIPVIPFKQSLQNSYLPVGTFPLTVTLNGTTYTGNVTVTATDININWTYTSGVTITPTHFSR
jgi:hypothetical protein